ncbi:MAG: thiamine-phosphate kinase [Rhodothermales bacterium]
MQQDSFTTIADLGEFGLIDRIKAIVNTNRDEAVLRGIDDDAAVYSIGGGRVQVVTTDALVEGLHFNRAFMPMPYLGFKAMSVNVSDVVAMNAQPRYATVALGVPTNVSVEMIESVYKGMQQAAERYGVTILGGDTTGAHRLTLTITLIGEASEDAIAYRTGAKVGDAICVTGDLGASYAGLKVLVGNQRAVQEEGPGYKPDLEPYRYVINRHLTPTAQLDAIAQWHEHGFQPTACIDISDGLSSEIHHIARQSNVGALLHAPSIPIALETRSVADMIGEDVDTFALFGGEDYELLFTASPEALEKLPEDSYNLIGTVKPADHGVQLNTGTGESIELDAGGYTHF